MSKQKKLKTKNTNFQNKNNLKKTPLVLASSLPSTTKLKKKVSSKIASKQAVTLPKQLTKQSLKTTQGKLKAGPPVAESSKIQNLPKHEHVSVFGAPTKLGTKVSCFTVRSTMPPNSKQTATSLPIAVGTRADASKFTVRSTLVPSEKEALLKGEFGYPLPGPTRIDLVRRLFFYLVQLLTIHFVLTLLCCYISGFTQWGKLMIILGSTYILCSVASLFGLLLSVSVFSRSKFKLTAFVFF